MNNIIKKLLKKIGLYNFARRIYRFFHRVEVKIIDNRFELEQMIQVVIMNQYKIMSLTPQINCLN